MPLRPSRPSSLRQRRSIAANRRPSVTLPALPVPLQIGALLGWWDTSDLTTLSLAGGSCSSIADRSGRAVNLAGSIDPTTWPTAPGAGLLFNGTSQVLSNTRPAFGSGSGLAYPADVSCYLVAQISGSMGTVAKIGGYSDGIGIGYGGSTEDVAGDDLVILEESVAWVSTNHVISGGPKLLALYIDGSGLLHCSVDGTVVPLNAPSTLATPTVNTSLGAAPTPSGWFRYGAFTFFEACLFEGYFLGTGNDTLMVDYLSTKWLG